MRIAEKIARIDYFNETRRILKEVPLVGPILRWVYGLMKSPTKTRHMLVELERVNLELKGLRNQLFELRDGVNKNGENGRKDEGPGESKTRPLRFEDVVFDVESPSMDGHFVNDQYHPWITRYFKVLLAGVDDPIVFDIGANVGLISIPISFVAKTGTVFAFEAFSPTVEVLRRNVARNNVHNITIINRAVGSSGEKLFVSTPTNETIAQTFVSSFQKQDQSDLPEENRGSVVESITIDGFVRANGLKKVDLIKIDVEGWEEHVLRGAEETIRKYDPCCIIEFDVSKPIENPEETAYVLWRKIKDLFDYV